MKKELILWMFIGLQCAFQSARSQNTEPVNETNQVGLWWDYAHQVKVDPMSVPTEILTAFREKYPGKTEAEWHSGRNGYLVSYSDGDTLERQVLYNRNGKIEGTIAGVKVTSLPNGAITFLTKKYPEKSLSKIYMLRTSDGTTAFMVSVEGEWNTFDSEGNLIPVK